ncbi:sigma-70 family RNA polymerase sigma factor [Methylobrevis pamukkalensis]|uniref:ECF RNA polymerase sigma factor SigR n=1 Tax=Methylobrevis pamukkalensis TaxID=1439726 RepID=A0A1E3H531_9HYPH|nr:sigma-70 family RNA polymerase sigma factor [Methylobrevis pamukkalensis]ODN71448.1 ECF RNA polymerase sigma factor SigR [Methylobrevis pamukkalensis]
MKLPKPVDLTLHTEAMLRYARTLARGDHAAAEDMVGDALVRALEAEATFRQGGNLRGWLLSILHNTFVSARRRAASEQRRREGLAAVGEASMPPPQEGRVRLSQLAEAFERLPDEQRQVLHLVAVEGLAYQDAADILGIPVGTLMSRLGRARAALRRWEEGGGAVRPSLRIVGGTDGG